MKAWSLIVRSTSTVGRIWREASRRRRIAFGLVGVVLLVVGWVAQDRFFRWPSRLTLVSPQGNYPVAFSPDGSKLVTSMPSGFSLWDTRDGRKLADWPSSEKRRGTSGKFSPDGQTFLACWSIQSAGQVPILGIIDVATGQVRSSFPRPDPFLLGHAFINEGATIRLLSRDKSSIKLVDVDVATGKVGPPLPHSSPSTISWQIMADDGRTLALVDTRALTLPTGHRSVILWDLDHDRQIGVISTSVPVGSINAMALDHAGKTLVMTLSDQTAEVWDIATGKLRIKFRVHSADFRPWMVRLSADGTRMASIGQWASPTVSLNTARFLLMRLSRNPNPDIFQLDVHDLATGQKLGRTDDEGLVTVFSKDGRILASSHRDLNTRIRDLPASR